MIRSYPIHCWYIHEIYHKRAHYIISKSINGLILVTALNIQDIINSLTNGAIWTHAVILIITIPADVLAPADARLSVGTVLTTGLNMFPLIFSLAVDNFVHFSVQMMPLIMVDHMRWSMKVLLEGSNLMLLNSPINHLVTRIKLT